MLPQPLLPSALKILSEMFGAIPLHGLANEIFSEFNVEKGNIFCSFYTLYT
jgi:hypothetical protein